MPSWGLKGKRIDRALAAFALSVGLLIVPLLVGMAMKVANPAVVPVLLQPVQKSEPAR